MDKQKGISTTLILLIVLLVVIVGGGIVYKYYLAPEEEPSGGEPGGAGESQDETAGWETYRNEELGIEFKYPPKLEVNEVSGADKKVFLEIEMSPDGFLTIGRREHYNCDDESTWLPHCDYICEREKDKEIKKDIKINGHSAKFVSRYESNMEPPIVRRTYICVEDVSSSVLFDLTLDKEKEDGKYLKIFNQMLSTFHFLEGTVIDELPVPNAPNLSYLEGATPFVQINWNWDIADYFNIYRATNPSGPWGKIISNFPKSAHTAVDYDLPEGVSVLYYKITSVDEKGNESKYSEISSVKIIRQLIKERIEKFMSERIKRDTEKAISYLTENAILKLGGESNAKQYLVGVTNPHLYKYEITSIAEISKGTLGYPDGGYKVIIKGYEEYNGEGEVGSFVEGLNLIEVDKQWFINEIIEKQYD